MTVEGLQNYLTARLALNFNARQHLRLLRLVFGLVFAFVAVVHLLIRSRFGALDTLLHATVIALIYAISVGMAAMLIPALRKTANGCYVWQIWVASGVGFVVGFYLIPIFDLVELLADRDMARHSDPLGFVQLLPVWILVTYLFIQPHLSETLRLELDRLREMNALLDRQGMGRAKTPSKTVLFESGRTSFSLDASSIRNVAVEDHYCYVHYRSDGGFTKRDLLMPLRDVLAELPEGFVQVHRSHIVNVTYVSAVRRKGRNIRLILEGGFEVPVSRHRLEGLLPKLQAPDSLIAGT